MKYKLVSEKLGFRKDDMDMVEQLSNMGFVFKTTVLGQYVVKSDVVIDIQTLEDIENLTRLFGRILITADNTIMIMNMPYFE